MKKHEKHIERNDLKGATHLEVSVYYTKGGMSYFTGGTTPRGYYLSVRPITKGNGTVSFDLFAGHKQLLLETNRYTDKQFDRAVNMATDYEDRLVETVVADNKAA